MFTSRNEKIFTNIISAAAIITAVTLSVLLAFKLL